MSPLNVSTRPAPNTFPMTKMPHSRSHHPLVLDVKLIFNVDYIASVIKFRSNRVEVRRVEVELEDGQQHFSRQNLVCISSAPLPGWLEIILLHSGE